MLDHILALILVVVVPASALWRSRMGRSTEAARGSKVVRYRKTIITVVGLLALLVLDWRITGRTVELLGLGFPATRPALIGLAIATLLLAMLAAYIFRNPAPADVDAALTSYELMPQTPAEVRLFLLLALALGFGWEVLYRGFLLFYLPPAIGLPAAVVTSAIAYGAAHGFDGPKQFAASIATAFAFAGGYVLTENLWWLIVLHTGLPLLGLATSRSPESGQ